MWQKSKNLYHLFNAALANAWHRRPSRKLKIIGVTGTDGKTTTVNLIYHILKTSGQSASMISTVGAVISGEVFDVGFHVTNPDAWKLQQFIKKAVGKDTYLVLEVTSHGLDQHRVFGIPFAVGVLTNVTHEHLDYHKSFENYVKTKAKLLFGSKTAVVNRDDQSYQLIEKLKTQNAKQQSKMQKWITYGFKKDSDVNPQAFPFKTNLIGQFNKYNCLAAIAACQALGISDEIIRKSLETFKPPIGRQEIVHDGEFMVIIDFAHTPNSFLQVLWELSKGKKGRLIHVFGAAGKRDQSKRTVMGEIAAKYDDIIVLTAEDPRGESVEKIMDQIAKGMKVKRNVLKITNRKEAIAKAISLAKKGDIVLLTGKSHEKSMNFGNGEEPWSEYQAVEEALEKIR